MLLPHTRRESREVLAPASSLDVPVWTIMRPGVITVAANASLRQVQRAMASHRVHAVLVVGKGNDEPLGWVTAHRLLELGDHDAALTRAGAAVTQPALTVSPTATAADALELLLRTGAERLLVCRAHGAEGVVTEVDLVALLAEPAG